MTDLWTKPITADGATATPEQMREAWAWWLRDGYGTMAGLSRSLAGAGVTGRSARHRGIDHLADRMLWHAKKAGVIRYVKGRWEVVDGR